MAGKPSRDFPALPEGVADKKFPVARSLLPRGRFYQEQEIVAIGRFASTPRQRFLQRSGAGIYRL
jgi:hypothetical protein